MAQRAGAQRDRAGAGLAGAGEPADEQAFVRHLTQGAQALGRGAVEEARASLEEALTLRPRDAKALGLIGQALYRQGLFEQAAVAWQRLVEDNPAEPGARVNLGLAQLKARRLPEAVRQLEIALDLQPEHKKALGYLGLALLESGDPGRARGCFARAGSEALVARCDELLAAQAASVAPPHQLEPAAPQAPAQALGPLLGVAAAEAAPDRPADPLADLPPGAVAVEEPPLEESVPAGPPDDPAAPGEAEAPFDALPADGAALPAPPHGPDHAEGAPEHQPEAASPAALTSVPTLSSWAAERMLQPPAEEPFAADGAALAVAVHGELLCRLDGLLAWRGQVGFLAEVKRFRGRATDKPFGERSDRMHRLDGHGLVLLSAVGRRFTVLDLGGDAAFFREVVVFGLEEVVAYENGRLASPAGDVDLVHLRGQGRVVLRTAGEPLAVAVTPEAPVRVPARALVGWVGGLTPRLSPAPEGSTLGGAVELSGQGLVLVDRGAVEGP